MATVSGVDRIEEVRSLVGEVLADQPVLFSYLFGSVARGDARDDSDLDVALAFDASVGPEERFQRTLRIGGELERRTGLEVDVVDLGDAPLRLQGRILIERIVLTGLRSRERVAYETELFPRYIDVDHHARRLDAEVLAAAAAERR